MDQYDLERERLKRRRAVSDAMLRQSMQPMGGTEYASGIAVRRSPLEGLAKLAQAYMAKQGGDALDTDEKALGARQRSDIAAAMDDYSRQTTPRAESISGEAGDELYSPAFTPGPGDKRAAAMGLMGKIGDPRDAAKMMVADALKVPEIKAYKPGDVLYQGGSQVGSIPKTADPYTLSPGATRYGADGKPIVTAPEKAPDQWSEPFNMGGAMVQKNAKTGEVRTAVSRPPVTNVNTVIRENDKKFEKEDKLRNDYTANPKVKASAEMDSAFKMIEAAYKNPTAANDLAMATKYMKILDPTSVVRESEFALAVSATGLIDKVQNYAASVLQGKKLNPAQRKDFYDSAKAINDSFQQGRATVDSEYSEIATGYGLEPKNVIPSLRSKSYAGPERRGLPSADAIDAELRRRAGGG